jgi:hypothetical protein
MTVLYLLYREISDQYGTDELVGVYSNVTNAEQWAATIRDRRTFIKPMLLDNSPKPRDR